MEQVRRKSIGILAVFLSVLLASVSSSLPTHALSLSEVLTTLTSPVTRLLSPDTQPQETPAEPTSPAPPPSNPSTVPSDGSGQSGTGANSAGTDSSNKDLGPTSGSVEPMPPLDVEVRDAKEQIAPPSEAALIKESNDENTSSHEVLANTALIPSSGSTQRDEFIQPTSEGWKIAGVSWYWWLGSGLVVTGGLIILQKLWSRTKIREI